MATLIFINNRFNDVDLEVNPRATSIFQTNNPGFLWSGSLEVNDGLDTNEATGLVTASRSVRVVTFFQPEDPYRSSALTPSETLLRPLNFRLGVVQPVHTQTTTVLLTNSPTHQFLTGTLAFTSQDALGSLSFFSIWGSAQQDPLTGGYVETATALESGGVSEDFERMHAAFVPHPDTRYLGVGAKVYSMPSSGSWRTQYFKKWMVEEAGVGNTTPSTEYGAAREVIATVRPDRLNYFRNPSFEVDASGFIAGQGAPTRNIDNTHVQFGAQALLLESTVAAADMSVLWGSQVALPVDVWTMSWYIWTPIARDVWLDGVSGASSQVTRVMPNKWVRVHATFELTTAAVQALTFHASADSSQPSGTQIWADGFLLERGEELRDFFDGSWSADTIWETGGTTGLTRSYLYKNRAERYAALKRVLADNVPLGIGIHEPVFGTLPPN